MDYDPLSLPIGANPEKDQIVGYDELGEPMYRSLFGDTYHIVRQAAPERVGAAGSMDRVKSLAGGMLQGIWDGFTVPGRAASGEVPTMGSVLNTAGLAMGGRLTKPPAAPVKLASRSEKLYNLPTKSEVDDGLGRQHSGGLDLEGRPLVARHVVGRAPERSIEKSLSQEALAEILAGQTRDGITLVEKRGLPRGTVGGAQFDARTRQPLGVNIWAGLDDAGIASTTRHEAGHVFDEIVGQIPTGGLSNELKPLYNYGIEGRDRTSKFTEPKHLKYTAEEAPRENMAEAIRQYMSSPDEMKNRAPKTAARIRQYVNTHPSLSKAIQFNALGGAAFFGSDDNNKAQITDWLKGLK